MTKEERILKLNSVFSPMAPIKRQDFFSGRINQLNLICDAINEEGQHAILYGERGVGKTSLANIMTDSLTNVYPIKLTCSREDKFVSLWKNVFDQIQYSTTTTGIGFKPQEINEIINLGSYLNPNSPSFSKDILNLLRPYTYKFLFIFDEFDNVEDSKTRESFADLIKSFSDNNINSTIVLVGIADDVESLIGNHQSLERCLKQVKMPRMSDKESGEIIDKGLHEVQISIDSRLRAKIIEFSSGFPHYIHLLCKYGAKEIIENEKFDFSVGYFNIALKKGIENTAEQLKSSFRKAIVGSTSKWQDVLYACAQSTLDEFNLFSIPEILKQYNKIVAKDLKAGSISYNLAQLCLIERGKILEKFGKGIHTRYRFTNPMMRAYVKLKINSK